MKFARNLSASEIVEQALHFRRMTAIDHCVFMGMGEPMLNLENVLAACERLPDVGITHRRTAISTVGWIPGIEALTAQEMPLRLALSLHAADEALRSELMPINERYPLVDVIDACRAFYERKRRRVFVEYVMLAGVNDRYEQALALARLLEPRRSGEHPAHVQGQPDPVQPNRLDLRRFQPRVDRGFQGSARVKRHTRHGAAHARTGYRRCLRATRRARGLSDVEARLECRRHQAGSHPRGVIGRTLLKLGLGTAAGAGLTGA